MALAVALAGSDPREHRELAGAADACGCACVYLSDHVVRPERIRARCPCAEDGLTHGMTQPGMFHNGPQATLAQKKGALRRLAEDFAEPLR